MVSRERRQRRSGIKGFLAMLAQVIMAFFILQNTYAAEDCTNGYDDDLDGFVDCYDMDCAVAGVGCDDFFVHPGTFLPGASHCISCFQHETAMGI